MRAMLLTAALVAALVGAAVAAAKPKPAVERVGLGPRGEQAPGPSYDSDVSDDGKVVTWSGEGFGGALSSGVFVRDLRSGRISLASRPAGAASGGSGFIADVSGDGRSVAFRSDEALVSGDANRTTDVFVRDVRSDRLEQVSVSTAGVPADGASYSQDISDDGRLVAFDSAATNLVPGDRNDFFDLFLRDRKAGTTIRLAERAGEPALSGNGRVVAFVSLAGGDQQVVVRDLRTGTSELVDEGVRSPALSDDGRRLAYVSFIGLTTHVRVRDRRTGASADLGEGVRPVVSGDGQVVAFTRPDEGAVIVVDLAKGDREEIPGAYAPALSGDGREVVFTSSRSDLVPGDTNRASDIFLLRRAKR